MSSEKFRFNLIDEAWIPCVLADGTPTDLNLRDVLARAHEIRDISDASPAVTISLHRLLLAILHRSLREPTSVTAWNDIWVRGAFDMQRIGAYLDRWHARFDLFDDEHPFYQTGNIDFDAAKPIGYMVHGMIVGNNATLFDHSVDMQPEECSPAAAARYVVALQSFALGGFVSTVKGEDRLKHGSAFASPLARGIVTLVSGQNLFETLMLNYIQYNASNQAPFPCANDDAEQDRPAWERDQPTQPADRNPDGYVDLLSWQSRRARLQPERDAAGNVVVRYAAVMKGYQFRKGWEPWSTETMLTFREVPKPKEPQAPFSVLSFSEARSLWRDSDALFGALANHRRPKTVTWLGSLAAYGFIPPSARYQLSALGVLSDRKSIDFWRVEQLPVTAGLLDDESMLGRVEMALAVVNHVGRLFQAGFDSDLVTDAKGKKVTIPRPMQIFADAILAPGERTPESGDISNLIQALEPAAGFWPELEMPFKQFLLTLPDAPDVAFTRWLAAVETVARAAFTDVMLSFDTSGRSLRAAASAQQRFNTTLAMILRKYRDPEAGEEEPDAEANAATASVH